MKIAVTGANGFVGSSLLRYLSNQGHDLCAILRTSSSTSLINDFPIIKVDYNSQDQLSSALEGVDILIHNAGLTKALSYAEFYHANVDLTRRILRSVNSSSSLSHFIYISSQAASRPSMGQVPVTEEDTPSPVTWYGKSKLRAEELIRSRCQKDNTIIRPCSIYGPGDKDFLQLAKMLASGLDLQLGRKDRFLNMIFVEELAEFISLVINSPQSKGESFFASDGQPYRQSEISLSMLEAMGKKALRLMIPDTLANLAFRAGDFAGYLTGRAPVINSQKAKEALADGWLCSIDKARRLLGYNPSPKLKEHMTETIKWYKESSWL